MVIPGLVIILFLVLLLPFAIKKVEEHLELFLFIMGVAAAAISGILDMELILTALQHPIMIASAVLIAGALFFLLREQFTAFMQKVYERIPVPAVVFLVIALLGLLSSVITAIIASIVLVEVIYQLPLERKHKVVICISACFAIGLGAALTPIGEPLATIAVAKLDEGFLYLVKLLGIYIIPAVFAFALLGAVYSSRALRSQSCSAEQHEPDIAADGLLPEEEYVEEDTWRSVIVRALKVYLFVMALTFLGEGFQPLIDAYILQLDYRILYWVNSISAVLDNATLAAAEISYKMSKMQIEAVLMGLIIAGGMLIPGNIPNIISASKLRITSTEWAKYGVPAGITFMALFYVILFII